MNKVIKFIVRQNLAVNQQISFKIWKSNGTPVIFANGQDQITMTIKPFILGNPANSVLLGTSKEQMARNIALNIQEHFVYAGFSSTYIDNVVTITIDNTDGFEHIINGIYTPDYVMTATDTPCDTMYIVNDYQFSSYQGTVIETKTQFPTDIEDFDPFVGSIFPSPSKFNAEIERGYSYSYKFSNNPNYIVVGFGPTLLSQIGLFQTNQSVKVNISQQSLKNFKTAVQFSLNDGPFQDSSLLHGLNPNAMNYITIRDRYGCELTTNLLAGDIEYGFVNYPQPLVPVYNPVAFSFILNNFQDEGFRYIIELIDTRTLTTINKFKIAPTIDGSGYVELSRMLSNYCSVDFKPNEYSIPDARKSYVQYAVTLGMEYVYKWDYTLYSKQTGVIGIANTVLTSTGTIMPNYQIGDKININDVTEFNTGSAIITPLNGVHTVIAVNGNSITIDVPWFGYAGVGGKTTYANFQKIEFSRLRYLNDLTAWNGALPWLDFKNFISEKYTFNTGDGNKNKKLLTSLPTLNENKPFYVTKTQDLFLNYYITNPKKTYALRVEDEYGNLALKQLVNTQIAGYVQQFKFQAQDWITNYGMNANSKYFTFHVVDGISTAKLSSKYRVYVDNRCKIEDVEIAYMDRTGSILSQSFQLRKKESGSIERETYNQNIQYNVGGEIDANNYSKIDLTIPGILTSSLNLKTTYELNTNWMEDCNSVLFGELMSSPYTWIKLDGQYYGCTVQETNFEVVRQKNKNLIRKTINVVINNEQIINI